MTAVTLREMTAEMERLEAEEKRIEEIRQRRLQLQKEVEDRQSKANEFREQLEKLMSEREAVETRLQTESSRIGEAISELQKELARVEGTAPRRGRPKGSKNKPKVESHPTTGKRRPGRPKGSKNKPKVESPVMSETEEVKATEHHSDGRTTTDRPAIDYVVEVLENARQPLNLEDIAEGAKALGFTTTRDGGTEVGVQNALYTAVWGEERRAAKANEMPRVVKENTSVGLLYSLP